MREFEIISELDGKPFNVRRFTKRRALSMKDAEKEIKLTCGYIESKLKKVRIKEVKEKIRELTI